MHYDTHNIAICALVKKHVIVEGISISKSAEFSKANRNFTLYKDKNLNSKDL